MSLSWTPYPRVVVCSEGQMNAIIENCTGPSRKGIFSIDTVYNIGDFYVTSTSYQIPALIHNRTNNTANLPGPAMFHVKQERTDFLHFAHSLIEKNEAFEKINFVGGDRSQAQRGFMFPLKISTFLPCTMHTKDDIKHVIKEHNLNLIEEKVLQDIFGSERYGIVGLIDCEETGDFLDLLSRVLQSWDEHERSKYQGTEPKFAKYFEKHISNDMANGMLKNLRHYLNLGDGFYYNNAQECSNKKLKSKITESKIKECFGYCPSRKCSWLEGVKHYEKYVLEENKNTLLAIIGKGLYSLAPDYTKYALTECQWNNLNPEKRRAHLLKINTFAKHMISSDCI